MKAFIYNVETNEIAVVVESDSQTEIHHELMCQNYDQDIYGHTFCEFGLIETNETTYVNV